MVTIMSLWLPILLSAVFMFIVSSLIHTVLKYHANDYRKLQDEDGVADALRKFNIPKGSYHFPRPASAKDMRTPEYQEKVKKGPNAMLTIWPGGAVSMTKELVQWFVYGIVVSIFAAYVAGRALNVGAPYLEVFRFAGATAFACYAIGGIQDSIWFKRPWATTCKNVFDGLVFALLTGGTFGWLWPR